jgi:hypothetical protein
MSEIDIVAIFMEMDKTQDACVPICNVKTARIACIPIGVLLHQIGVWWRVHMLLASLCRGEIPLISCGWGGNDIASWERAIGRECFTTAKQWRGLTHRRATSAATSTSPVSKSRIVGPSCALGRERGLDKCGGRTSPYAHSAVLTLSHVTGIEHEGG